MIVTVTYITSSDGTLKVKGRRVNVPLEHVNSVRARLGLPPQDELTLAGAVNHIREFGIHIGTAEIVPSSAMINFVKSDEQPHSELMFEDDGERQMLVMALAHLAVERPGWNQALLSLAMRVNAEKMFDDLRCMHQFVVDHPDPAKLPIVSNPVDGLAKDFEGKEIPFVGNPDD